MESDSEMSEALPLFVTSRDEAMTVKKTFELKSGISYVRFRAYAGKEEITSRSIHYQDKSGVVKENEHPFIIVKTDTYECMYGRDRHASRRLKEQAKDVEQMKDHPVSLKRTYQKTQASRKKGCPAKMIFKEIVLFTDYKMNKKSDWEKRQMGKAIRSALDSGEVELAQEHRVYIKYPTEETHLAFHELRPMPKPPRVKITVKPVKRNERVSNKLERTQKPHAEVFVVVENVASHSLHIVEEPSSDEHVEEPSTPKHNTNMKILEKESWGKVKEELCTSFHETRRPVVGSCVVCQQKPDRLVTCRECSRTGHVFCRKCAIKMHKQHCLLHKIVEWQNDVPVVCNYVCTFTRQNHQCSTVYSQSLQVLTDGGYVHHVYVKFCKCESAAATLVRFRLWPCSARKPITAVSLDFMDFIYCMTMEGKLSLKSACNTVGIHSNLGESEVKMLYRCIGGECIEQFRDFRDKIQNLSDTPLYMTTTGELSPSND